MILEFSVTNFRSFKDKQTLSFEPTSDNTLGDYFCHNVTHKIKILKFAVLYGYNASGKTNLLNALKLLRNLAIKPRKMETETGFIPFQFNKATINNPGEFEIHFYYEKIKYHYLLKVDVNKIHYELLEYYPKGQPVEVFTRSKDKFTFGSHKSVKTLKKYRDALETNTVKSMTLISALQNTNVEFKVLQNAFDWFKNNLMPMISPKTNLENWTRNQIEKRIVSKKLLLDLLNKADFQINKIEIIENEISKNDLKEILSKRDDIPEEVKEDILSKDKIIGKELFLTHSIQTNDKDISLKLPFDYESEGTKRYFGLGGPLSVLINNTKILSIDEIESSLHPELINYFINVFLANSTDSQLIVTSHNLNLISDPDEIRRDVVWFTEKNEFGGSELYALSDFKSSDIRKGMNYLKAYKSGKFGAIPKLGSIFIKKEK